MKYEPLHNNVIVRVSEEKERSSGIYAIDTEHKNIIKGIVVATAYDDIEDMEQRIDSGFKISIDFEVFFNRHEASELEDSLYIIDYKNILAIINK